MVEYDLIIGNGTIVDDSTLLRSTEVTA